MIFTFDQRIARAYHSASQKIRVMAENWVNREIFCPACGQNVTHYENNRPVADFYCSKCSEEYELKSKKDSMGQKLTDGAYQKMIERLKSQNNPNLFLLNYDSRKLAVQNFFVVPKHFFIPTLIEKRKPLSGNARRAGWIGCNIALDSIPLAGKIFYIRNQIALSREKILLAWKKTLFLREEKSSDAKGWVLEIMSCIEQLGKKNVTLNEIYKFEEKLRLKYPNNKHIKDKIRQQLQFLRDKGYLEFVAHGKYRLI